MSTKIYYAYRMPTKVFAETFLPALRQFVLANAKTRVGEAMGRRDIEPEMRKVYDEKGWAKHMPWEEYLEKKKTVFQLRDVYQRMYEASIAATRDPYFCIDCSLNVWLYKGKAYCMLYGEPWLHSKFPLPDKVEDYAYWDNCDGPEGITWDDWKKRGKTWDKVCLEGPGNWDAGRLVHQIINAQEKLGLIEIARNFLKDDDVYATLPPR